MYAFLAAIRSATPVPGATPGRASAPPATPELIRDVAPPVDYFPYPMWMVVLAGVLAAALLVVLAYYLVRWMRRVTIVAPPRPRAIALAELERLRTEVQTMDPYAFSIAVSHVLRRYVESQYRVPALEQTSPEFLAAIAQNASFSTGDRQLLEKFLDACDAIKFARIGADAGMNEQLLDRSFNFVRGGAL